MGRLNLVMSLGYRRDIAHHALKHYREFVDDLFLVLHPPANDPDFIDWAQNLASDFGAKVDRVLTKNRYDWRYHADVMFEVRNQRPDEWWLLSDDDELQVYPIPIRDILKDGDRYNFNHVYGGHLDRAGEEGLLSDIDVCTDLNAAFPYAGSLGLYLEQNPMKIALCKGYIRTYSGNHYLQTTTRDRMTGALNARRRAPVTRETFPRHRAFPQIHHFKWSSGLPDMVREIQQDKDQIYEPVCEYLKRNSDKVDITEERCRWVRTASTDYPDYPHWSLLVDNNFFPEEWDVYNLIKWCDNADFFALRKF